MSGRTFAAVAVGFALTMAACSSSATSDRSAASDGATTTLNTNESTTEATFRDEPELDSRLTQEFVDSSLEDKIADFLESPNSGKSAVIATEMGDTGDIRWAPWILDLHRLAQSTITDRNAIEALGELSGLEAGRNRGEDFQIYGTWAQSLQIDPGAGYREWKLGLYGIIDDEFAELLATVPSDQLLSEIHWGGVTRGGIPELNDPARLPVSEAEWMVPEELVLGVEFDDSAVAYPVRILGHHELANDIIDGVPVSIVYCTLCRTGLAFDRRFDSNGEEQVLDFQTSGLLWSSNKVMVDNQTDTLWQHLSGVGIGGPLEGEVLTQLPLVTTTWADWIAEHPDSETLELPPPIFFPETPERPPIAYPYDPGGAYQGYYENPDVWFPILDTPDVFALKTPVLGLSYGGESLAVEVEALQQEGPLVFEVGGQTVLAVPTDGGARVFDANGTGLSDGDQPTFEPLGTTAVRLSDGTELARLVVPQAFWFAWFGDHQETKTWPAG